MSRKNQSRSQDQAKRKKAHRRAHREAKTEVEVRAFVAPERLLGEPGRIPSDAELRQRLGREPRFGDRLVLDVVGDEGMAEILGRPSWLRVES